MQTIVFDFFGVICSEIADIVLAEYLPPEDLPRVRRAILHDADLGLMSEDTLFEKLAEVTGAPAKQLEEKFWARVRIDGEVVKLIEGLRQSHRIGLLTNATVPFVREIMARHNLERLFHAIMVSSEEGLIKPNPAFYRRLLDRMETPAEDSVMIDDNPVNLAGARAAGMQSLLFGSAAKLANDLAESYSVTP